MENPYAIYIHCDGAMDYNTKQTGGNGFVINFPDSFNCDPILKSIRNDGQGIHRLEMISIIEAMKELLAFGKGNDGILKKASGVCIYTDRFRVTDEELTNPYRIQEYRRNGWNTHENKPIKDKDLLDKIDKTRKKLCQEVGGRVEIKYKREKNNKIADKLSKVGKNTNTEGRKLFQKKMRNVIRRKLSGSEISYSMLQPGNVLKLRVYAWEVVQNQCEISAEIITGENKSKKIKIYVSLKEKQNLHRDHHYTVKVGHVYKHHIQISSSKEIRKTNIPFPLKADVLLPNR